MTVPIIPSIADELGGTIDDLSKSLEKFMNPHIEFQKAMTKAIGSNPDLAQQLADLEYNAPGTLDRMGFGKLGEAISAIPESQKQAFARKNRGEIDQADKAELDVKKGQSGLSLERLNDAIGYLKDHPDVKADVGLRLLTGETTPDRESAQLALGVQRAKAPLEQKTAEQNKAALDAIVAKYPHLAQVDFMNLARTAEYRPLEANWDMISAINTGFIPGVREAYTQALQSVHDERIEHQRETAEAARFSQQDLRDQRMTDKQNAKQLDMQANQAWENSNWAGSKEAWKTILTDPSAVAKAKAMTPDQLAKDQGARDLLLADASRQAKSFGAVREAVHGIDADIGREMAQLDAGIAKDINENEIQLHIARINTALDTRRTYTNQKLIAHYGTTPTDHWYNRKRVWFSDGSGNEVDPSVVHEEPAPPGAGRGLSSAALDYLLEYHKQSPAEQKAGLDRLVQGGATDLYDEVIKQLKADSLKTGKATKKAAVKPPIVSDSGLPEPTAKKSPFQSERDSIQRTARERSEKLLGGVMRKTP